MYNIHGVIVGAHRVILKVAKVPRLQEVFIPIQVVYSKRELGFDIIRPLIAYDRVGSYPYNGELIPSFVLKVVG